jgi:N-acylneuraminate cytidylyltransferase
MIIALIPARGGSKRVPRKNIRKFDGRPLIYYSIAIAKANKGIDRCIVSTEDHEIAEVATECGAEVIQRPLELADDLTPTVSVAKHVLSELAKEGNKPDAVVTLQPNCPLRPVYLLNKAIELFLTNDVDSVVSVTVSHQKLGEIKGGYFIPSYPVGVRAQDLKPLYFENGLIYVSRTNVIFEKGNLFGSRVLPLLTDPLYAYGDIDTELDFQISEFIFKKFRDRFAFDMNYKINGKVSK